MTKYLHTYNCNFSFIPSSFYLIYTHLAFKFSCYCYRAKNRHGKLTKTKITTIYFRVGFFFSKSSSLQSLIFLFNFSPRHSNPYAADADAAYRQHYQIGVLYYYHQKRPRLNVVFFFLARK